MAAKAKAQRIRVSLFTKVILLLLLLGIGWQLYMLTDKVEMAQSQKDQLSSQVSEQRQKNDALTESIENGGSQEQMEEIARDELDYVGPFEKVFYDVSN